MWAVYICIVLSYISSILSQDPSTYLIDIAIEPSETVLLPANTCRKLCSRRHLCVMAHPRNCHQYISCTWDARPPFHTMNVRDCAFGTFYNPGKGDICDHTENVNCPNDPCKYSADYAQYKNSFGCRSYWRCEKGVSRAHCCPVYQSFNGTVGRCVPDFTCGLYDDHDCGLSSKCTEPVQSKDNCRMYYKCTESGGYELTCCAGERAFDPVLKKCVDSKLCTDSCTKKDMGAKCTEPVQSKDNCRLYYKCTESGGYELTCCAGERAFHPVLKKCVDSKLCTDSCTKKGCYLVAKVGDPTKFLNGNQTQSCSPGTIFSKELCTCVQDDKYKRVCLPVINEDFTRSLSRKYYQNTLNVDPIKHRAVFGAHEGSNSYIPEYFFDESFPAEKMLLNTNFIPGIVTGSNQQVLVSSCSGASPIQIVLDPTTRELIISASSLVDTVTLRFQYTPGVKHYLSVLYDNHQVKAEMVKDLGNGISEDDIAVAKLDGDALLQWHTPMFIGGCPPDITYQQYKSFVGEMETLTVYHGCLPGEAPAVHVIQSNGSK